MVTRATLSLAVTWTLLGLAPASADPPPPYEFPYEVPEVYCFRVTDIVQSEHDENRFLFMFEILNWTQSPVHGLHLARNSGGHELEIVGVPPYFFDAHVDKNGRRFGKNNDDKNFPPQDGQPGVKVGRDNRFQVFFKDFNTSTFSLPEAQLGEAIPNRQLAGLNSLSSACEKVPSCVVRGGTSVVEEAEQVDNGAPTTDGLPDNVLDGFVIEVADFHPGEMLSFNWYMLTQRGDRLEPVGLPRDPSADAMGFGVFNIFYPFPEEDAEIFKAVVPAGEAGEAEGTPVGLRTGPPVWTRDDDAWRDGANVGTSNAIGDMFVDKTRNRIRFQVEAGAALSAEPIDLFDPFLEHVSATSNCVLDLTLESARIPYGGYIDYAAELYHVRHGVARAAFQVWIEDAGGQRTLLREEPAADYHHLDRVPFGGRIQLPLTIGPGSYHLVVTIDGMRQGTAEQRVPMEVY